MQPDVYLEAILTQNTPSSDALHMHRLLQAQNAVGDVVRGWASIQLHELKLSGSNAKGTANRNSADLDLLISLKPDTVQTLSELHTLLHSHLTRSGYTPRLQNVSLGVTHGGVNVDLVPAKKHSILSGDHSLYTRKNNSWVKTNIETHISTVRNSGKTQDMRLTKIWRDNHGLEFPSFYLEMSVISAIPLLASTRSLRFLHVLNYLANNFVNARVVDPANSNNIISDELTLAEKRAIANKAAESIAKRTWNEVVW